MWGWLYSACSSCCGCFRSRLGSYDLLNRSSSSDSEDGETYSMLSKAEAKRDDSMATSPRSIYFAGKTKPVVLPGKWIIPGSEAQLELARSVSVQSSSDKECVICMESFDAENPCMPTLCSCGENRAMFHMHCLLVWMEQHSYCPTCRGPLYYEEIGQV